MKINRKKIIYIIAGFVFLISISGAAFYGGYKIGFSQTRSIRIEGVADIHPGSDIDADFSVFWQAWSALRELYLRAEDVSKEKMIYGAIKGLAENMGDPHTTFFTPEEAKQFEETMDGQFGGIGAELERRDNQIIVVAPLRNTPAEKAGLRPKDIIIKAGGVDLFNKTVQEAIKIIRGEPGTKINLTISREGYGGTKEIEITREIITLPTVEWEWKEGRIAYIRVINFNQAASFAFWRAVREINQQRPKGIVLDLRNNPGGYLEVAVELAGWFIERGEVIVRERHSLRDDVAFRSNGNGLFKNLPTVVLINRGTASAAEIMAGAMRDINETKLIGEKTFGKGTVQTLEELKDGSMLKITVANWVTPGGHVIEGEGLDPDIHVKATQNETEDIQLIKAIKALNI